MKRLLLVVSLVALTLVSVDGQVRLRKEAPPGVGGGDYMSWPLLDPEDIVDVTLNGTPDSTDWKCSRAPLTGSNGAHFDNAPMGISYDTVTGHMYAVNYGTSSTPGSRVAVIDLPTMTHQTVTTNCPTSSYAVGFYDPVEGQKETEADTPYSGGDVRTSLQGILVTSDRLYGAFRNSYDNNNAQIKAYWSRPRDLTVTGDVKGIDQFWNGSTRSSQMANPPSGIAASSIGTPYLGNRYNGMVSGYMFRVPVGYQPHLGGYTMGGGQASQSLVWRGSYGPAAFLFSPAFIGSGSAEPHPMVPLVYYDASHQTLGPWDIANPAYPACVSTGGAGTCPSSFGQQNTYYGFTTAVTGCVIIDDTRTMACFGKQGAPGATPCYGYGTADLELVGDELPGFPGTFYCYDPVDNSKGNHQFPTQYYVWLYDMAHIIEAYNETRLPWNVVPYNGAYFELPVPALTTVDARLLGADWNAATRELYLLQGKIDVAGRSLLWKRTLP